MELIRECFLLLSFLAIAQFAQGRDNFPVANQLMDLYGRSGSLSTIQWSAYDDFENEWKKAILDPKIKPATANTLNHFFHQLDVARDNYRRAMDSMVTKCTASLKILPRLLNTQELSVAAANKEITRFMNAFGESRTHLDAVKYALESAEEYLTMVDPQQELSTSGKRFVITDFENGTATLEAEGDLYERPETLERLLRSLSSHPLNPLNRVVTINFRSAAQATRGQSQKVSAPNAIFARVENINNHVIVNIRKVDAAIATIADKVDNFIENDEVPSDKDIEALRRKCEAYHPV